MAVVGPRASEIIHHEIAAVRLDGLLEALQGRQQIRQIIRTLGAGDSDAAPPQPVGNLGGSGGARLFFFCFAIVSHALQSNRLAKERESRQNREQRQRSAEPDAGRVARLPRRVPRRAPPAPTPPPRRERPGPRRVTASRDL